LVRDASAPRRPAGAAAGFAGNPAAYATAFAITMFWFG